MREGTEVSQLYDIETAHMTGEDMGREAMDQNAATSFLQREGTLEAILDTVSDGILTYDADFRITSVNRAALEILGYSADEVLGRHCREVFRCGQCEPGCGFSVTLSRKSSRSNSTVKLHTASGQERLAIVNTSVLTAPDGRLGGVVVTFKDVTESLGAQKDIQVIGESEKMRDLMEFVRKVAASEATTILVEGESGTGKDLIAKTLHYESSRQAQPFVAINCSAIPETLLEAELFGYEKGSFTDAKAQKKGLFELAPGGTLFLDEIGEMPLVIQAKLLRVLEDQTFRRIGGLKDITVDVRLIAATNRSLADAVREGLFRQDLYYRLNVIPIAIPPLRQRGDDILPLAEFFVRIYNRKFRKSVKGLTAQSERLLRQYHWPGNVRELRNAIERAMILEDSGYIRPDYLPLAVTGGNGSGSPEEGRPSVIREGIPDQGISLQDTEKMLIEQALRKTRGNQTHAARLLSITRDTLRYKIKKYGIPAGRG
jgi:PAS domain S-box-containing protein